MYFQQPFTRRNTKESFPNWRKIISAETGKNKEPWKEYMSISNIYICVCVYIQINNNSLK